MQFYMRLPRNKKEFAVFLLVISLISVNIIAPLISFFEVGFHVSEGDSFNVHMLVNTVFSVLLMSVFLTVIGSWIGTRSLTLEPIHDFFYKWPRNFAIAFFVEACIAQPIARWVMNAWHSSSLCTEKATTL